jgi:integrase/recombinase XerD
MQEITTYNQTIENLIEGWLLEKRTSQSGSVKTDRAYRDTIQSFRDTLRRGGLDLDSQDTNTITDVAGMWAAMRVPGARRTGEIAGATYNQRLAILSSFYVYCQDQAKRYGGGLIVNPIKEVKRRKVQAYAAAVPLDGDDVMTRLAMIDQSNNQGKRDYALLMVALLTGRRASELVGLRWRDIKVSSKRALLTFYCKGGKVMRDRLEQAPTKILLAYLQAVYGPDLEDLAPESPVWVSFSKQNPGQAISTHTLNDLCERVLGTSQIHALRHTFAYELDKMHASLGEIAARLGHTREDTTSRYIKAVRGAENPFAGRLAARFGIQE